MDITNAVVIVTGASSGIGEATARLAHDAGARVVLAARRADRLAALAAELPGAFPVTTDVTQPGQVGHLVKATVEHFGRIDIVVNNAGQGLHQPLEQVWAGDLSAIFELNVVAPLMVMQAVLPVMRRQGGGAIVNISSGTSRMVLPGVGAYAATKCALNMLTQVARAEFAADGVSVSLVLPSLTDTDFHDSLRAGTVRIPAHFEPHSPEVVARAILAVIASGAAELSLAPSGAPG